jgi:deoxyribose-phosphate aldolase
MTKLNHFIDHTLLKADATQQHIIQLCDEAKQYEFASVCVQPSWVRLCAQELKKTNVAVCTVIGFPLGANSIATKAFETEQALREGATEFDMVINIGRLKDHDDVYVKQDIEAVVKAAQGHIVKVIIETALLNEEEKIRACHLCVEAKAHFVKTSTGFASSGASVEDVVLMKQSVGNQAKIKAAGGVRTLDDVQKMIDAGADRIGTSSGVALIQGLSANHAY